MRFIQKNVLNLHRLKITIMKLTIAFFQITLIAAALTSCAGPGVNVGRVVTNPIDLDYSFYRYPSREAALAEVDQYIQAGAVPAMTAAQKDSAVLAIQAVMGNKLRNGTREAADPVVGQYGGKYYLFPSKSKGYWSSDDMQHWQYIPCKTLPIDLYAPTVMNYKGEFYWMTSDINEIYKTTHPEDPSAWELVTDHLTPYPSAPKSTCHDPYLFKDDDERVYLYWGCSDRDDIMGLELDPENAFTAIGEPVSLIKHMEKVYGWEQPGDKNEIEKPGYNEGPCLFKYEGSYYLQYAGPGTEFDTYGEGLYIGKSPLGPYEHCDYSPICLKPGGWMTGAGHGETFKDKHGNWWHVASTVIAQRMPFERRIGFFPMVMTPKGHIFAMTQWSDLPYVLPDGPVDFSKQAPWTGWMDLSIHKTATASSSLEGFGPERAADNTIKTWWSAKSGAAGEWLTVDLGRKSKIYALQTNFADQDFGFYDAKAAKLPYRYTVEFSGDGNKWATVFDKSGNTSCNPHELLLLPRPLKARYVRITNCKELSGKFSIFDLRVFGLGSGKKPSEVKSVTIQRNQDRRRIALSWPAVDRAQGYVLHWGVDPEEMYNTCQTEKPEVELGLFSTDQEYYFSVDSFNESGVSEGKVQFKTK